MKREVYYRGKPGKKYGIWNDVKKEFQFGICEDTPMLAEARLFQKLGDDARKWRFQPRMLPDNHKYQMSDIVSDSVKSALLKTERNATEDGAMDNKEKLVELIFGSLCRHIHKSCKLAENIADDLIAHGVTVQEWISVKDRLPDTIPCGAGTEYSEAVNVLTDGRKVLTAIWNGLHWIYDPEFWDAEFEEITHWTPVLCPCPNRRKENDYEQIKGGLLLR